MTQSDEDKIEWLKSELRDIDQDLYPDNFWYTAATIGTLYLECGEFEKGWRWYTSISKIADCVPGRIAESIDQSPYTNRWRGEPLAGKSILILQDQGTGDILLMARYFKELKKIGATVKLVCKIEAVALLRHQGYIDIVRDWQEKKVNGKYESAIPNSHFYAIPSDLPMVFSTTQDTIPSSRCIRANPLLVSHWKERLHAISPRKKTLRVGIVWQGNPDFPLDSTRSLPSLSVLAPLFDVSNVHFFSLQKNNAEARVLNLPNFTNLGDELNNFSTTAAVIDNLDLVISSDTSVANLCGAMGRNDWIMVPGNNTCWRWMRGNETPWYPTLKLFRQSKDDADKSTWENVVRAVACELQSTAASTLFLSLKKTFLNLFF